MVIKQQIGIMIYQIELIAKGIKVTKSVTTEKQADIFERDMPAKYNLLFSGKPYMIKRKYK